MYLKNVPFYNTLDLVRLQGGKDPTELIFTGIFLVTHSQRQFKITHSKLDLNLSTQTIKQHIL